MGGCRISLNGAAGRGAAHWERRGQEHGCGAHSEPGYSPVVLTALWFNYYDCILQMRKQAERFFCKLPSVIHILVAALGFRP